MTVDALCLEDRKEIFRHSIVITVSTSYVVASLFQLQPHPAAAICTKAARPLFRDDFCKGRVFLRSAQTMDEITGSASRYLKKAIHKGYRIFVSVSVEHRVFCPWPHSLPVEHRKSRNSSFFPDIVGPPNGVLFSYIRRPFVYCPLLRDRFIFWRASLKIRT